MITKPYTRLEYNSYLRNLLVMDLMWPYGNRLVGNAPSPPHMTQPILFYHAWHTTGVISQLEQLYRYVAGFPTHAGLIESQIPYYYRDYARDYNRFFGIKSP